MACTTPAEEERVDVDSAHETPSCEGERRPCQIFSPDRAWRALLSRARTPTHRDIPKVDLHCHLNGSISAPLLSHMERLQEQAGGGEKARLRPIFSGCTLSAKGILDEFTEPSERMKHCFSVFDNVYKIMTNAAFTRMAVQDLLLHSASENVFILEIRSSLRDGLYETPSAAARDVDAGRITKKVYLETVIATAEHLMDGGVVDFVTGELLPVGSPVSSGWWSHFRELYGSLAAEAGETVETLWTRTREHLMRYMHIRLLVSINRGQSAEAAMEAVKLAKELQRDQLRRFFAAQRVASAEAEECCGCPKSHEDGGGGEGRDPPATLRHVTPSHSLRDKIRRTCWVSGIDFSGYCGKNMFSDFLPALREVRCTEVSSYSPLGITLHAGERPDAQELAAMIEFRPERWGHLTFTEPVSLAAIIARHDPVELCITSNIITGGYTEVSHHHLDGILAAQQQQQREEGKEVPQAVFEMAEWVSDADNFSAAMQCRLQRRLARWQRRPKATSVKATRLPNVSFHTDDRGVFGTSMTNELELLLLHPSMVNRGGKDALALKAVLALERLSLPHVFEIPLEVVYYCTYLENVNKNGCDNGGNIDLAYVTEQVEALDDVTRERMSFIELCWLMEDFDAILM